MTVSSNQATRKSFNKSLNTFSDTLSASSNTFSKKSFVKGSNPWEGPNTSATALGADDPFGGPFSVLGVGEFGGIGHFLGRTNYSISR